eukprot:RCo050670
MEKAFRAALSDMARPLASASLAVYTTLTLAIAGVVLAYYTFRTSRHIAWPVYATLYLALVVCFAPVPLLLVDISSAKSLEPSSDEQSICHPGLVWAWQAVFWTIQVFTWVGLPVAQSFMELSGHFKVTSRLAAAVVQNLRLYLALAVVCGSFLIWLCFEKGVHSLPAVIYIASSCSNAFGLFLTALLMAYGLVAL